MEYDIFQQQAIEAEGGYHLVLAPPGCGKTDILSRRIETAHRKGVAYADMLCLTFTNRASKGMQERVCRTTGEPVPSDLFIGNVHRYCAQYLFEHGIVAKSTAVIDETDFDSIVHDLAIEMFGQQWGERVSPTGVVNMQHALRQYVDGMDRSLIVRVKELDEVLPTLLDLQGGSGRTVLETYEQVEMLWPLMDDMRRVEAMKMIRLCRCYELYKEENDMLDFDDLLLLCYHVLTESVDYKKYPWIQIDEVQDLNALQLAIVDLLTADGATVVYLGDEQQSIYSFIGANREIMELLKTRCEGQIHRLYKNYRSPSYLLDVSNAFAVQQLNIDPSLLPSTDNEVRASSGDLYVIQAQSTVEEYDRVVAQAVGIGAKDDGRVAILVPMNMHADKISDKMLEKGVPHFKISGTDLFTMPTVQVLFSHLGIAQNEGGFTAWAKLLYHSKIIPRYSDAREFMRNMRRIGMLPTDFLNYEKSSYLEQISKAFDERETVIFDTETSGLDVFEDEIIQIAAVKVKSGRLVEGSAFNVFLDITKPIPPVLKGDMVNPMVEQYAQNPHLGRHEGFEAFRQYCEGCVLVGHNVEYDYHILEYNLQRDCPEWNLRESNPEYYDTLKFIRLVEPRLRHYNLANLLVSLGLEGQNSHMADDDIMATWELLKYCRCHSDERLQKQRQFWSDPHSVRLAEKIRECYGCYFRHTVERLYEREHPDIPTPLLVRELDETYQAMVKSGFVKPLEKWHYIIDYLKEDLINPVGYASLKEQLAHYNGDLLTCKEADLCGSRSVTDRYFVSTVHKAKGLEFESVIIFEANADKYPSKRSTTMELVQEDARKFYVALSRAKKRLCVACTQKPTPFLDCIKDFFEYYVQQPEGWKRQQTKVDHGIHSSYVQYRYGARLRQLGKLDDAEACFRKALMLNPNSREASLQLADLLLLKGAEKEAQTLLHNLSDMASDPQAPLPFANMGPAVSVHEIVSMQSRLSDENQTILYQPDPYFARVDGYPKVMLPDSGTKILYPRQGRSEVRGFVAKEFYQTLSHQLSGVHVTDGCHIAVPCSRRAIEPCVILYNLTINLLIAVEVDAPYDGVYRFATHTDELSAKNDLPRDRYLTSHGWVVVRFSERQVALQQHECMLYLQDIVNAAHNGLVPHRSALSVEPCWSATQAMRWQQELYREKYLAIPAFPPYDYSVRVVVPQPEEPHLVFDEQSHVYAPEGNRTGGANYLSVTTLIGQFFPFDTERYLERKAADEGRPMEEVRAEWDLISADASNRGTELHADIEHFLKGETIVNDSPEYAYFQQFYQDKILPGMEFVDAERVVMLPDYNVAGTVDALFRRKRDGAYVMVDWKRSRHLIIGDGHVKKYGRRRGLSILGHLDDSSYYHYELQQSFYKYILKRQYGIEVEHMMLCVLHPELPRYYTIRLENYREREVKALLETINLIQ